MHRKLLSKFLSLALALSFLITSVAGCGKTDTTTGDSTKDSTTKQTADAATKEATKDEPLKPVDMGGYEYIFASHWIGETFPEEGTSTELQDKVTARINQVQKDYNCKITPLTASAEEYIPNITAAVMAGDKYADTIDINLSWLQSLRSGDSLKPLGDVKNFDLKDSKWTPLFKDLSTFGGKTYGVNFTTWGRAPELRSTMIFNKSLLQRENQPNPYELVKNNQWTWDKFREICKACTKDTNGDGKNDIFGFTTIGGTGIEYPLIFSNGGAILKEKDGKLNFALTDSDAQEAIKFAADLINVDKVFKEPAAGTDWTQPAMDFMQGNIAFFSMEYYACAVWFKDMKDDFGIVPVPKGPQGKDYVSLFNDARFFCMTSSNKDTDKSAIIFNALTEPLEGVTDQTWKDELRETVFRDNDSVDMYDMLLTKGVVNKMVGVTGDAGGSIDAQLQAVTRFAQATPTAAMASIKDQVQSQVDEFYKQK